MPLWPACSFSRMIDQHTHTHSRSHPSNTSALVQRISALPLPPNFLDTLIEKLGGPRAVAEMTGRKGRVVRDSKGHGVYELRAKPDSSEMDSLNVKEAGELALQPSHSPAVPKLQQLQSPTPPWVHRRRQEHCLS